MDAPVKYGEGHVVITRMFDAPRALVWKAWTDPTMMAQWFGPRGFTSSVPGARRARRWRPAHRDAWAATAMTIR